MAYKILMPRLGWTMEQGILGAWLKIDGDRIQPGDMLFSVEGDKAVQEVESFESGILRIPPDAPAPGDVVQVGALLGYLLDVGESPPFEQSKVVGVTPGSDEAEARETVTTTIVPTGIVIAASAISPRARRVAAELGVEWEHLRGSGISGRIVELDVRIAAQTRATVPHRITPVAQRLARDAGIDLAELTPKIPGGSIRRGDVESAIRAQNLETSQTHEHASDAKTPEHSSELVRNSRVRQLIAQRMMESAHGTAPVTLTSEADATEMFALREHLRKVLEPRSRHAPSYNDLLIKLTALALQKHPGLNAMWQGETIQVWNAVHIGLAVDTAEGLVVPVVRDAHCRSVGQIATTTRDLIVRAQLRQLQLSELQGATFTITNLGMYGIDAFTPIINLPQCAILGVGRIQARPTVLGDQIVSRKQLTLSLTFDHRVVDGGPAARFLNTVREFIEEPAYWIME